MELYIKHLKFFAFLEFDFIFIAFIQLLKQYYLISFQLL